MRIQDSYTKLERLERAEGKEKSPSRTESSQALRAVDVPVTTGAASSVNVSARARELAAASAAATSSNRIAELREKVKNGTLAVDANAIARSLVGDDS